MTEFSKEMLNTVLEQRDEALKRIHTLEKVVEAFQNASSDTLQELYAAQKMAGMTEKAGSSVHGAAHRLVAFMAGYKTRAESAEAKLAAIREENKFPGYYVGVEDSNLNQRIARILDEE